MIEEAPPGCLMIVAYDLFTGIVCTFFTVCWWSSWSPSARSAVASGAGAAGGIAATSLVVAGMCLRVREPFGWRVGTTAQLMSAAASAALAVTALFLGYDSEPCCGLGMLPNLVLCGIASAHATVSFVCFVYLLQPHVKRAFGFDTWP